MTLSQLTERCFPAFLELALDHLLRALTARLGGEVDEDRHVVLALGDRVEQAARDHRLETESNVHITNHIHI